LVLVKQEPFRSAQTNLYSFQKNGGNRDMHQHLVYFVKVLAQSPCKKNQKYLNFELTFLEAKFCWKRHCASDREFTFIVVPVWEAT